MPPEAIHDRYGVVFICIVVGGVPGLFVGYKLRYDTYRGILYLSLIHI